MVNLAQDFHRSLTLKDDQIHSLGQGIERHYYWTFGDVDPRG
jgi:hypothetical protein